MNQGKHHGGKKSVGSPHNVSKLTSGEIGSDDEDKRLWFKKYRTRQKRSKGGSAISSPSPTPSPSSDGRISDKKNAQIQMALSCLSHPDMGAREHGLKVLVNIGLDQGCLLMMTEAIPSLVELMGSESSVIQMFATFVLANIAIEPLNRSKMRRAGVITTALRFLESNNPEILEKALWLLTNITREQQSRRVVVEEGGIPTLLALLNSSQMNVVIHTVQVFRTLFYDLSTQLVFAEIGGINVLVRLFASQKLSGVVSVDELRLEWSNLICLLAYFSPDIRAKLVEAEVVDILCNLLSVEDKVVVGNSAQALINLSTDRDVAIMIADTAGSTSLIQQLISSSHDIQELLALLLTNLGLASKSVLESFPQFGGIEGIYNIISEIEHPDPLLWKIIYLIATVSRDELCRRELLEMGAMPKVEQISETKDENLKLATCMALHNLKLSFVHLKAHKEVRRNEGEKLLEGDTEKASMHRARVINEIVNTEKQYVENLLIILKVFQEPLEKIPKLLSRDERKKIFSICNTLYILHSAFLGKLQKVVLQAPTSGVTALGDVFQAELVQQLKVYRLYINNYDESCDTLVEAKSKPAFASWLEEQTSLFKSKKLDSLLITPIQRIPRYCLLLTELLKHMPSSFPDYKTLSEVLQTIQDIANYLEEEKQIAFSKNEFLQMQKEITNIGVDFTGTTWRRFIRKGTLLLDPDTTDKEFYEKSNLNSKVPYVHFWLMTDQLVVSKDDKKSHKHKLVGIYDVGKLSVTQSSVEADGIKKEVLKISTGSGTIVVFVVGEDILETWYLELTEEIQKEEKRLQEDGPRS